MARIILNLMETINLYIVQKFQQTERASNVMRAAAMGIVTKALKHDEHHNTKASRGKQYIPKIQG